MAKVEYRKKVREMEDSFIFFNMSIRTLKQEKMAER